MGDNLKRKAARAAMAWIKPGMKVGLGTGSTANELIDLVGDAVGEGLEIVCVPTSRASEERASALNIPLATLDQEPVLDLTIDGADEIGPDLVLIKGGGGAHLREKIVASASKKMLVIADASKKVDCLGQFPLPLEIAPFGFEATRDRIREILQHENLGADLRRREKDGSPVLTDSGNFIIDAHLQRINDPRALAQQLDGIPGLVEHGLFIDIATAAMIASDDGVETLEKDAG